MRATPKSPSLKSPVSEIKMLAGLMSRWMMLYFSHTSSARHRSMPSRSTACRGMVSNCLKYWLMGVSSSMRMRISQPMPSVCSITSWSS